MSYTGHATTKAFTFVPLGDAIDPHVALKVIDEVTVKLLTMSDVERPTQYAIAFGIRNVCLHLGWTPEEMLSLDDANRAIAKLK